MDIKTLEELIQILDQNKIKYYGETSETVIYPAMKKEYKGYIRIHFSPENPLPDVWESILISNIKGIEVSVSGTRIVSGNGAIDGMLLPEYAMRRESLNEKRKSLGFQPIGY